MIFEHDNDEQPTLFHFVLTAKDAERHVLSKRDHVKEKLGEYGLVTGYQIQAAFDEAVISYELGLLQIICVDIGSHALKEDKATSLSQELGKLLSPFPGVLLTPGTTYTTPVYNANRDICHYDEIISERAKPYRLSNIQCDADSINRSIVHYIDRATIDRDGQGDIGPVADPEQGHEGSEEDEQLNDDNGGGSEPQGEGGGVNDERELSPNPGDNVKIDPPETQGECHEQRTTNRDDDPEPPTQK